MWDGVASRLGTLGHPVAAVDQRGHGRSDKPQAGFDFATLAADFVALERELGWQPGSDRAPLVAGQSWGGNVVLELAIRQPDATRAIACVDGGTIELTSRFPAWEAAKRALTPPAITGLRPAEFEAMIRASHPDWPETGIQGTLANVEIRPDGTIAPWLTLDRHLRILRQVWEHHPSERYPLVPVPVLLVPSAGNRADQEKQASIAVAEAASPRVRTRWFVPADHDVHAQHPDEVGDLLHAACEDGWWT
jgi:pimeloyl-ACP methyl ester carboxylesterase